MLVCPSCDYENHQKGRPVLRNGTAVCLDCGSVWKEFSGSIGDPVASSVMPTGPDHHLDHVLMPSRTSGSDRQAPKPTLNILSGTVIVLALFALATSLFVGYLNIVQPATSSTELTIADVRVETTQRHNGAQIVTVRGKIENNTTDERKLPPVIIMLRDKSGKEISRWRYNSLAVALSPGNATSFSSSIQHASTRISSAQILLNQKSVGHH